MTSASPLPPNPGVIAPPDRPGASTGASRRAVRVVALVAVVAGAILGGVAFAKRGNHTMNPFGSDVPGTIAASPAAPTTPAGLGVGWAPEVRGRRLLRGFSEVAATITAEDGSTCQVCLLAATDDFQRQRGLMEVTDRNLGGYDGMLFQFTKTQNGAFWMYNTPMPLSIAYFSPDGVLVSRTDMAPCPIGSATCPSYPAGGEFKSALEVPQGGLAKVGVVGVSRIRVDGIRCPSAAPGA